VIRIMETSRSLEQALRLFEPAMAECEVERLAPVFTLVSESAQCTLLPLSLFCFVLASGPTVNLVWRFNRYSADKFVPCGA
jgi:hypothetical protein